MSDQRAAKASPKGGKERSPLLPSSGNHSSPPKASELVAQELRANILGRALPAGTRLPSESELIETRGLSRATIREALRLLEADGLIAIKRGPRGGITVRHPDPTHISRSLATIVALEDAPLRHLFDLRLALEPAAAAAAASSITEEEMERLKLTLKHPDDAHEGPIPESVDFHVLVSRASGNSLYHMILAAFHDVLKWHVEHEELTDEAWEQTRAAHEKITLAIGSGDGRKAENAMRKHLEQFRDDMERSRRLDEPIIPRSAWLRGGRNGEALLG